MLSKEECAMLLDYLENSQYAKVKKFVEEQQERIYLIEALEAMKKYSKQNFPNCGYCFLPNNQLLLSTECSFFKLCSKDLYDIYYAATVEYEPLRPIGDFPNGPRDKYLEWINGSLDKYSTVISKKLEKNPNNPKEEVYRVKSEFDSIGICVKKDILDFSDAILGINTNYFLEKNPIEGHFPSLRAQSKKGKAYILSY